jgi:hypothetical protein
MQLRRFILLPALLVVLAQQLHAQIKVSIGFERRLFVLYEPVPITVAITNLSGHDIVLTDADSQKWFSFQITAVIGEDKRIVPPLDMDYKIPGVNIPAGTTIKHTINLSGLYAVQDIGLYRFKASIYSQDTKKYYSSPPDEFQVTEGRVFWQETVGVPQGKEGAGSNRTITLLTFRQPKYNVLYVRVEDKDKGTIYTTSPLGPLVAEIDPDIKLDKSNLLHVLQLVGPRTWVYSRVGLNGEFYDQLSYNAVTTRPILKKDAEGEVYVFGGKLDVVGPPTTDTTTAGGGPSAPKVSDRPPGFPAPGQ